jgi:peptidyl-prolyl cis-trans isomerase C
MTLSSTPARPASSGAFPRRLSLNGLLRNALLRNALALALVAAFAFAAPLARAQDDPVVARVNGAEIRQSDLAVAEDEVGNQQVAHMSPEQKRDYLISFISDMLLVANAAEAKKVADGAAFQRKLAFARNKLLMEQYLQAEAKAAVTEAAMRKVYDEAVGQMSKQPEVHARHILVETEDEAKAVLAELKKGADFAELAKAKSKDPGSADGGDLGYFTKDQMVPEFSEVAFKLDKGALSDPVKSQFGWHIIKVEDKRERQPPEFDKVKDQLEQYVVRRQQVELITKLRQEAKIEKLTPPAPPAPPAPAAPAAPPAEQKK